MKTVIKIKGLSVKYDTGYALRNVNLEVKENDFLGIMGPNGGGKSTLLKAMLGLVNINQGSIEIFGKPGLPSHGELGYVPQASAVDRQFPISVLEVAKMGFVRGGFHPLHKFLESDQKKALELLEQVNLREYAKRQIGELSGGEFQRLLIARAIAVSPKILFLDEPTSGIDPGSRKNIYQLLTDLNKNMTIVMVTHDLAAISSSVSSIACLNGDLVYHGEPTLTQEVVTQLYGCPVELVAHGHPHRVLMDHGHVHHNCDC